MPGVDLKTLLAAGADKVSPGDLEVYLDHTVRTTLPPVVDITVSLGDPPVKHPLRLTLSPHVTGYEARDVNLGGIRAARVKVTPGWAKVMTERHIAGWEDHETALSEVLTRATFRPPLSDLTGALMHTTGVQQLVRLARDRDTGRDPEAIHKTLKLLARSLRRLVYTYPGFTNEQAFLARRLGETWDGTPLDLLETVVAATHTT